MFCRGLGPWTQTCSPVLWGLQAACKTPKASGNLLLPATKLSPVSAGITADLLLEYREAGWLLMTSSGFLKGNCLTRWYDQSLWPSPQGPQEKERSQDVTDN